MAVLRKETQSNLGPIPIYNIIAEKMDDVNSSAVIKSCAPGSVALILSDPMHIYILNSQKTWILLL